MSRARGDTHLTQISTFMVTFFLLQKRTRRQEVTRTPEECGWRRGRGHAPINAERQTGEVMRKSQYCPSWLQIDFRAEYVYTEIEVSDSDKANVVSSFNTFCWQGPGGLKNAPLLPFCAIKTSSVLSE